MHEQLQEQVRNWLKRADEDLRAAEHEFNGEFYARTISTAYYAMFYAATGALASVSVERAKHSGVISAFGEHFIRTGKLPAELGRMFHQAMDEREKSDYDAAPLVDRSLAQQHLDNARRFVDAIKRYLSGQGVTIE